jgi:putative transposase
MDFVRTLEKLCDKTGWEVFAWVLMDNHYHLAVRTPEANLVEGMKWFQNTYTRRFNLRNDRWGHLFGGRYKAILVESREHSREGRWAGYLQTLVDYIHLNPARAGMVDGKESSVMDYAWGSLAQGYALARDNRPSWLAVSESLSMLGLEDSVFGRRQYIRRLDEIVVTEGKEAGKSVNQSGSLQSTLARGWYWGSQEFRERILEVYGRVVTGKKNRDYQTSSMLKDHGVLQAEKWIEEACKHYRISKKELLADMYGDSKKASVAWRICRYTTVSQKWVADHLQMKSSANVSQRVKRFSEIPEKTLPDAIQSWKELSRIVD